MKMRLDLEDENVQDDSSSPHAVNRFPSLAGFFPTMPLKSLLRLSYETAYQPYNFPLNHDHQPDRLHPKASTLTPNNKDCMESVRRSLVESPSVNDFNSNCDGEPDKQNVNLDNSALVIMHEKASISQNRPKKMTTFGRVSQLRVPTRKETDTEVECTNERFRTLLERILNNNWSIGLVNLLTIYCLFGDDFRTAFVPKSADLIFNIISIVCILIFSLEIASSIIVKPNYYLSFFFWLDLISAFSIMLDLVWIQNLIFMGGQSSNIARASRFSRFGARAGRVIRLVRLFRIVKLYKTMFEKQRQQELKEMIEIRKNSIFAQDVQIGLSGSLKEKKQKAVERKETIGLDKHKSIFLTTNENEKWYLSPTLKEIYHQQSRKSSEGSAGSGHFASRFHRASRFTHDAAIENMNESGEDGEEEQGTSESRVGKKLTDLTIKRVLGIVFTLIFMVPLFASSYWYDSVQSYDIGLRIIKNYTETMRNSSAEFNETSDENLSAFCDSYIKVNTIGDKVIYPLIYLSTPLNNSNCSFQSEEWTNDKLRDEERDLVQLDLNYTASINKKQFSINNSIISICRTFYICVVLGISALLFAQDAHDLVLRPIERMLTKVNNIARNPLSSKYQTLIENKNKKTQEVMETALIENAIVKISTLLALGLGDAGAEIITSNIEKMGDLVCITPGVKRFAVFGFCDIRSFTDATEVLQEDVMIFVNNIAEIVHTIVDRFQGSANKNIGDAFLLVWKFRIEDYSFIDEKLSNCAHLMENLPEIRLISGDREKPPNPEKPEDPKNLNDITDLCDLALMSFLKILCKINRNEKILRYRANAGLNARMHKYRVKMGFGLHIGWAIEGSIGSEYKIDASYLSPNVNLASRLEAATKQYGIPLLLSHTVYTLLSEIMKRTCRRIDIVTVKGSKHPLVLYTVDLDLERLAPKPESLKPIQEKREINALKKMAVALGLENKTFKFEELFMYDKDLTLAYQPVDPEFKRCFETGVEKYLSGEWQEAHGWLRKALGWKEDDGPSKTLIDFMERQNFETPFGWCGWRELVEK